jgi:hypothetical protein
MAALMPPLRRIGSAVRAGLSRRRRREDADLALVRELALLRREIHNANLIQYHRLLVEQASRAIDDPDLAAAWSTLPEVTDRQRRQLLSANREYLLLLLAHRIGMVDWDELIGHVRVLSRNAVFADYWRRTAEHRLSLPLESLESKVGRVVDVLVEEMADDPDEWWVVGPEEPGPAS